MHPVYFAHGYRQREAPFAAYFGGLMHRMELLPSLDPPSADVNAAKLERHLGYTAGLVAVVTARPEGPSPHILFEISMCLRAGKPLLVFVEDSLSGDVVPRRALQRRFSARSYIRETREHLHALEIFRAYVGDRPVPRYQPSTEQRSCLLIGMLHLGQDYASAVKQLFHRRGYRFLEIPDSDSILLPGYGHFALRDPQLAVYLVDDQSPRSVYLSGALQATLIPMIPLTINEKSPLIDEIPWEYQRRIIPRADIEQGLGLIEKQIELFEEDFVELDREGKAERYAHLLSLVASPQGEYTENTRVHIVQEITMGDKYVAGQAGAQGPDAHAHDMIFNQAWTGLQGSLDLVILAPQLEALRNHLRSRQASAENDATIGAIASAEVAARKGDGPTVLEYLSKISKWTLDAAKEIGVDVAAAALKIALGL